MSSKHKKMVVLAIIPARKNSKRVPGKNVARIAGKPLITYSFAAAKRSRIITDIVVSTDDPRVARLAERAHLTVIDRPAALAHDGTPTLPVLEHAVVEFEKRTGKRVDIVVLLQPTSPFRSVADIDDTITLVLRGADSAETFSKRAEHPSYAFTIDARGNAKALDPRNVTKPLRALPPRFFENGAVFVACRDVIMKQHTLYGKKHKGIFMPAERAIDIDEPIDIIIAEAILRGK